MVRFGGWNVSDSAFRCTLAEAPCLADAESMPQHLAIYTQEQIERIWTATAPVYDDLDIVCLFVCLFVFLFVCLIDFLFVCFFGPFLS